jgi:hypothetical protein
MSAALKRATETREISTEDGAHARVERTDRGESLTVRDRAGRLLFEYDAASGRGTLVMPEGDLRLCAPRGSIELVAARGIRASSAGDVVLESATGASVKVQGSDGSSAFELDERGARLEGQALHVAAEESDVQLGDTRARLRALTASVESAELAFGTVFRKADRVIEQAGNLYQRVSELCEIKAGRLRALVKEGVWMKGDDVTLLARKDVRVDGERINLG